MLAFGTDVMFTLNGGHVWPLYDAARDQGMRIVDTRHEQTATFAAEGWAKLTRRPGFAVLTAGPGITNGVSAITTAHFNGSPLVVLGGRAPQARWGAGLAAGARPRADRRVDHEVGRARSPTPSDAGDDGPRTRSRLAMTPHRGPVFLDFPLDVSSARSTAELPDRRRSPRGDDPDPDDVARAGGADRRGRAPGVHRRQRRLLGRRVGRAARRRRARCGCRASSTASAAACLPADHELAFLAHPRPAEAASRPRGRARHAARLPPRLRPLRRRAGRAPRRRRVAGAPRTSTSPTVAGDLAADPATALADYGGDRASITRRGSPSCATPRRRGAAAERAAARRRRRPDQADRGSTASCASGSARDAVVICDGGDFVSYAGKFVEVFEPGCWLDPGPYGCLGNGPGLRDRGAGRPPRRQVVRAARRRRGRVQPDGRRHARAPRPAGRDGRRQQRDLGPREAPDAGDLRLRRRLRPAARMPLRRGRAGARRRRRDWSTEPDEIGPALDRAFASGVPYLVNVLTDPDRRLPAVVQPRLTSPPSVQAQDRAGGSATDGDRRCRLRSHSAMSVDVG